MANDTKIKKWLLKKKKERNGFQAKIKSWALPEENS